MEPFDAALLGCGLARGEDAFKKVAGCADAASGCSDEAQHTLFVLEMLSARWTAVQVILHFHEFVPRQLTVEEGIKKLNT
jgi:hypothetical protein